MKVEGGDEQSHRQPVPHAAAEGYRDKEGQAVSRNEQEQGQPFEAGIVPLLWVARLPPATKVVEGDSQYEVKDAEERIDIERPVFPRVVAQEVGRKHNADAQETPEREGSSSPVTDGREYNHRKEGVKESLVGEAPTYRVEQKFLSWNETLQQQGIDGQFAEVASRGMDKELQKEERREQCQQVQRIYAGHAGYIERAYGSRTFNEPLLVGIGQDKPAQHEKETHSGISLAKEMPQEAGLLVEK